MPYTPPATRVTSPSLSPLKSPITFKKKKDLDEISNNLVLNTPDDATKDRDSALQEVKDILSTSPQLSTSPRRKSAPDSYLRRPTLKVELPLTLPHEIPCIIRKKSGEVVKPSLKKSKSEPVTPTATALVTPTFPKYVHFNADLEQIKLFNEAQKPQAVSAEVSDDDSDDDDDEFDFLSDDEDDEVVDEPELVISLPNRPMITTMHSTKPVFVESIFLSRNKKVLQGRVMVQNIAFQKTVQIRYTFDFWSTVSDVSATYAEGVPSKDNKNSFDVFVFSIDLIDNSRNPIDGKTMYFAVHYIVEDSDYWDNNNGSNYQVNFKRVVAPSLSTSKKNSNTTSQNPPLRWSMSSIPRPAKNMDESLGRSPPTFCSPPSSIPINNTSDPRRKLFGRYDIGVSLTAAQNSQRCDYTHTFQTPYLPSQVSYCNENFQSFFPNNYIDGMPGTSDFPMNPSSGFEKQNSNPISIPSSRPAIGSTSYYDLLNQYCFYSSSPPVMASS